VTGLTSTTENKDPDRYAVACREAEKLTQKLERLRSRLAAKSPKTLDELAALAVLALYWGETLGETLLEELARKEDRIAIGDRPLPTLLLAVLEVFGIDHNEFAS
jgi:hypothetical protein